MASSSRRNELSITTLNGVLHLFKKNAMVFMYSENCTLGCIKTNAVLMVILSITRLL